MPWQETPGQIKKKKHVTLFTRNLHPRYWISRRLLITVNKREKPKAPRAQLPLEFTCFHISRAYFHFNKLSLSYCSCAALCLSMNSFSLEDALWVWSYYNKSFSLEASLMREDSLEASTDIFWTGWVKSSGLSLPSPPSNRSLSLGCQHGWVLDKHLPSSWIVGGLFFFSFSPCVFTW